MNNITGCLVYQVNQPLFGEHKLHLRTDLPVGIAGTGINIGPARKSSQSSQYGVSLLGVTTAVFFAGEDVSIVVNRVDQPVALTL